MYVYVDCFQAMGGYPIKDCDEKLPRENVVMTFFSIGKSRVFHRLPKVSIYNQPPKSFAELKEDDPGMG